MLCEAEFWPSQNSESSNKSSRTIFRLFNKKFPQPNIKKKDSISHRPRMQSLAIAEWHPWTF